jgi:hypothetical protein
MKLPSYIEDEDIISKLQAKGIKLVSPVYRRAIPGTQVADGTRFVKCVFFVSPSWFHCFHRFHNLYNSMEILYILSTPLRGIASLRDLALHNCYI